MSLGNLPKKGILGARMNSKPMTAIEMPAMSRSLPMLSISSSPGCCWWVWRIKLRGWWHRDDSAHGGGHTVRPAFRYGYAGVVDGGVLDVIRPGRAVGRTLPDTEGQICGPSDDFDIDIAD